MQRLTPPSSAIGIAGSWEVRLCASQALGKVAVRSPEPFRIQAFSALSAAERSDGPGSSACCDPLGLAPAVRPMLEVLDAMYAGEQVVAAQLLAYGPTASAWPASAIAAVQVRQFRIR
jgi:hypothetical protein